ncbi:MAG TPA: TetR/AcrR family transcriptional regulator [Kineosporiaceae bacterium]
MPRPRIEPEISTEPETSQRMIAAAVEAFGERGYHATTTRDIAARAGLSPAALYVHYPSKAALLALISRQGHASALDLVTRAAAPGQDAAAALARVVTEFASWHARHHRVARVVQYEFGALPEADRAEIVGMRRRIEQVVEDLIRGGIAEGTMDVAHPRRVARAILSLCVDVSRWYDPGGRDGPDDLGALYSELALRMVGTLPGHPRPAAPGGRIAGCCSTSPTRSGPPCPSTQETPRSPSPPP